MKNLLKNLTIVFLFLTVCCGKKDENNKVTMENGKWPPPVAKGQNPLNGKCQLNKVTLAGVVEEQWCDWDGSWWWCDTQRCLRKDPVKKKDPVAQEVEASVEEK